MSTARDRQQQRAAKRASKRPTGKQIEELANRAEASGCDRCGTRFAELLPYLICKTHGGGLSVRCRVCAHVDARPVLIGAYGAAGGDPWSQDDRDWFATHPNRRWRLRKPLAGELEATPPKDRRVPVPQDGAIVAIAVHQIEVGKRLRQIVTLPTTDPLDSFTDAGIVRLTPGLAEHVAEVKKSFPTEADWQEAQRQKFAERLEVTAQFVRTLRP